MTIQTPSKVYTLNFWLLCTSSLLFFTSFNMIIPELPDYLTSLGGEEYKGLIIALFTITAGISRPFSGKLTDRVGRVPVMFVGVIVSCVCTLFYPIVGTAFGFLVIRFLHGFSTGFKPTGTSAFLADIVPVDRRGEALGVLGFFSSTGIGIGPYFGSLIALHLGLDTMFYISSAVSLLSILILMRLKETLPQPEKVKVEHFIIKKDEIIDKSAIPPSVVMILCTTAYGVILTLIPDLSKHLQIENKGAFFLYFTGASMLVRISAGKLSDKYSRVTVLKYSTMILTVALIGIGFASNAFELFAAAILLGIGIGTNSPSVYAWTIDRSSPEHRGRAIATMYIALEIGIGVGAFLSAEIYNNNVAQIGWAFLASAGACFLAFLYVMLFKFNK
ncbi:MFS transporter [Flammeovirga yaeyamensis]|uniref:MFS transporter n=1 Tax=Flammeovirga yaeyamensis TaxID=367791 RepID=A0AAX1N152_9BACT|nr:MFS transporter [Flammeovirga yaeyamensis]MBB3698552.1 MFS family permease [Flammeovirga yaeyamensis]NMF34099.1 MFS transporter [Flammeovirga yaeyamensis]QWG01086.1 MFS transporter [Flammeovirga yaeyamensis]